MLAASPFTAPFATWDPAETISLTTSDTVNAKLHSIDDPAATVFVAGPVAVLQDATLVTLSTACLPSGARSSHSPVLRI